MKPSIDVLRTLPFERRVEIEENLVRKPLTQEEIAEQQNDIRRILQRHQPKGGRPTTDSTNGVGKERTKAERNAQSTDALIGNLFGEGRSTVSKRREVIEAAESKPDKFRPLVVEMNRTGKVGGVYKKLKVMKQAEQIAKEPPPLPEGPFRVIVVDPPWHYAKRANDPSHRGSLPYPSLSIKQITNYKCPQIKKRIPDIAHDNCVLWLWTTNAHIMHAFEIIEAWGFEYKTMLTWVKTKMGTGDWLRGKTEHSLMCVKGKPTIKLTNQTTVINGPLRKHSQKPEEFYAMVEELCPAPENGRADIFSRTKRQGWISHGDEI